MRRHHIALGLIVLAIAIIVWSSANRQRPRASDDTPRAGAPEGLSPEVVPRAIPRSVDDPRLRALARAYAAIGSADDQGLAPPALDHEAAACAGAARDLLALDPPRRGAGRSTHGEGTALRLSPATVGEAVTGDAPAGGEDLGIVRSHPPAPIASAVHTTIAADDILPDPATALRAGADGPTLIEPGLWADARYRPDAFPRGLHIVNASTGDYAVRVLGDVERVRLDGGLIVPGRYYRVRGEAVLSGDGTCAVEIRPLSAVATWHEAPPVPPASRG